MTIDKRKGKKWIRPLLVVGVLLGMIYFAYGLQKDSTNWWALYQEMQLSLTWHKAPLLIIVILLMPINWWLETLRWQGLCRPFQPLSSRSAWQAILMGISASIITPNRVGEFAGRVVNLDATHRWKGVTALALGSMLQMIVIALGACLALGALVSSIDLPIKTWHLIALLLLLLLGILLLLRVPGWVRSRPRVVERFGIQKVLNQLQFVRHYSRQNLGFVALLTVARVCIYTCQFLLCLYFFGINGDHIEMLSAIILTYFAQSMLPLPVPFGLVARGELTLLVWNFLDVNELALLSASYLIWVINVFFPALIGSILLIKAGYKR